MGAVPINNTIKIALASPRFPLSISDGLVQAATCIRSAAGSGAAIICFPESFIPGYPVAGQPREKSSPASMKDALQQLCAMAAASKIAVIMGMDWYEADQLLNVAYVISPLGEALGYQSKNQLDPSEDNIWVAGTRRQLFEINGVKFGITICHEGFRYPESVRWAAKNGAVIVFHPHFTGSDQQETTISEWGHKDNPYYEKAMMLRAMENTVWFASVGYGMRYAESATSLLAPDGTCAAWQPYGKPGVLVAAADLGLATGLLAKRFKPGLFL